MSAADAALPTTFAFRYEACDIPPGMTIREFRGQRAERREPGRLARALRRLHLVRPSRP